MGQKSVIVIVCVKNHFKGGIISKLEQFCRFFVNIYQKFISHFQTFSVEKFKFCYFLFTKSKFLNLCCYCQS
jgi:hypothetical protein